MPLLETLALGVSLVNGVFKAAKTIHGWVTGHAVTPNPENVAARLQKLEHRIYYLEAEEVRDVSRSTSRPVHDLRLIAQAAAPLQRAMGMDLIVSTPIVTPDPLRAAFEINPEHLLFDIKPLNGVGVPNNYAYDPTMIPITFEKWGQSFVGLMKVGYARDYLKIQYDPQRSLYLPGHGSARTDDSVMEYLEEIGGNRSAAKLVPVFSRLIESNPSVENFIGRGVAYLNLDDEEHSDPDRAISDLSQAISLDPRLSISYFFRAMAYGCVGLLLNAKEDLERCLQLCTNDEMRSDVETYLGEVKAELAQSNRSR